MSFKTKFDNSNDSFKTSFSSGPTFRSCMASGIISGVTNVISKTTEEWSQETSLISKKNYLYVYTDHQTTTDEQGNTINVPGIKIGDGMAYVVDLPFIDTLYTDHINDLLIHVSSQDREFWNNKVTAFYVNDEEESENLILTKDFVIGI